MWPQKSAQIASNFPQISPDGVTADNDDNNVDADSGEGNFSLAKSLLQLRSMR